jgi:DNA polymerase-3 subunit gamma/tau
MAYQVIARKYRPQRFADVVGQDHVTRTLSNAVTQNRIAHAYLFCGPRGTGKTTIARIFAKCLNCTDGPSIEFTDEDPRCQEIAEGRSIDVLEIDGASNNGVEQVRELRETVKYAPASSKFKIFIIDEVHMLTTAAFNALLKTLEEPPEHVKFMFATTDPEKVLPTILSRCQRFDLRRIPVSLITSHLTHIAGEEKVTIEPEALNAIARGADGGMRDAESALDQLISFCGTLQELNELAAHGKDLGRLLSDLLNHFRNLLIYQVSRADLKWLEVSGLEAGNLEKHSALVSTDTLARLLELLAEAETRIRDATSRKIFLEGALLRAIQARNSVNLDTVLIQLQRLRDQAGGSSGNRTVDAPQAQTKPASRAAQQSEQPVRPAKTTKPDRTPQTTQPAPPTDPASLPAAAGAAATPAVPSTLSDASEIPGLTALWRDLLDAIGRASPFTRNYLIEAHPVSLDQNVFTIGIDPEFADHLDLVSNQKTRTILQTKLKELGHPDTEIKFIKAERPADWNSIGPEPKPQSTETAASPKLAQPSSAPSAESANAGAPDTDIRPAPAKPKRGATNASARTEQEFENDPLIRQALETFKGRIVEVRA